MYAYNPSFTYALEPLDAPKEITQTSCPSHIDTELHIDAQNTAHIYQKIRSKSLLRLQSTRQGRARSLVVPTSPPIIIRSAPSPAVSATPPRRRVLLNDNNLVILVIDDPRRRRRPADRSRPLPHGNGFGVDHKWRAHSALSDPDSLGGDDARTTWTAALMAVRAAARAAAHGERGGAVGRGAVVCAGPDAIGAHVQDVDEKEKAGYGAEGDAGHGGGLEAAIGAAIGRGHDDFGVRVLAGEDGGRVAGAGAGRMREGKLVE